MPFPATPRVWTPTCRTLAPAAGCDEAFDTGLRDVLNALAQNPRGAPARARWLAEKMALLLQASLLVTIRAVGGFRGVHRDAAASGRGDVRRGGHGRTGHRRDFGAGQRGGLMGGSGGPVIRWS